MNDLLVLAVVLVLISLLMFFVSGRQQKQAGLPGGRVVYSDTRAWGKLEKPLYVPSLGLTGKPDYMVESDDGIIPIEVKKVRNPLKRTPYDSHIYQVAAYCLMISELYEQRPLYGLLHYTDGSRNRTFAVDFTPALETAVRTLVAEIQSQPDRKSLDRSHEDPSRCHGCGFRQVCDQRL
jgi:CRISPR-associated exonuclease Cas4